MTVFKGLCLALSTQAETCSTSGVGLVQPGRNPPRRTSLAEADRNLTQSYRWPLSWVFNRQVIVFKMARIA